MRTHVRMRAVLLRRLSGTWELFSIYRALSLNVLERGTIFLYTVSLHQTRRHDSLGGTSVIVNTDFFGGHFYNNRGWLSTQNIREL